VAKFKGDQTLEQWGVEVNDVMTKIDGKKLPPPRILNQNNSVDFKQF
jgi:hypothetical protein